MNKPLEPFQATLNGKKYTIDLTPIKGMCNYGNCDPVIHITKGFRNTRSTMDTLLHEMLHACDPKASEKQIEKTATSIARVLWRLYRPR